MYVILNGYVKSVLILLEDCLYGQIDEYVMYLCFYECVGYLDL